MFRSVSIWMVGVAAMGVVLITFLNGLGVTASTTQGWQVTVGDQQPISVNANSIGTALFQGEFRMETRLDASGNLSPQSVCTGFPEVQATRDIDDNDDYSLELRLDVDTCRIVVNDVKQTIVSDVMASATSEAHEEHWGRAVVEAADGLGVDLTQSKVMLDYASSLTVYGSANKCKVQSPASSLGIDWYTDGCVSSPITHHGTYVKAKTTGDFYATQDDEVWDESIHSSSVEIKGYSTKYVITCRWWPSSIEDLESDILGLELGVSLECKPNEK
ncbi:MAG: hypothetical protein OXC83_05170 [Chloroflexi bacterium]|nr:hypothetical protein [Chloroflexota bacterium]